MKNILLFLIILFSSTTGSFGQVFEEWHHVDSPRKAITEINRLCGDVFVTDKTDQHTQARLWHSPDLGDTWEWIDYPLGGIGPAGESQRVYQNASGIAVERTVYYPYPYKGSTYTFAWDCDIDSLVFVEYFSVGSNGYDYHKNVAISNDADEFYQKYYKIGNGSGPYEPNWCHAWTSADAIHWTESDFDCLYNNYEFTPDTIPVYFTSNDTLYESFNGDTIKKGLIPNIVQGRRTLTAASLEEDVWLLSFENGQIIRSYDQGSVYERCAPATLLNRVGGLRKRENSIYFKTTHWSYDYRIESDSSYSYVYNNTYFRVFKHKGKSFYLNSWSTLYSYNGLQETWTYDSKDEWNKLYQFPEGTLKHTKNELFYIGKNANQSFIFRSIDAGLNWQIHFVPFDYSDLVIAKNNWFAFEKGSQLVRHSKDLGQSWTDYHLGQNIDSLYTYKNKTFAIAKDAYYIWNDQSTSWDQEDFSYEVDSITDVRLDEFLLFRRESKGDTLFNFYVTDLLNNQSKPVKLPNEFYVKKSYPDDKKYPGATDYLLNKGALYICDRYEHQGILYAKSSSTQDTVYIETSFCSNEGLVLGDTTLYSASTETIHYMDNFHNPTVAVLDIVPYSSNPILQYDTIINSGDRLFGQKLYADTIFNQILTSQYGCDSIIEWNVHIPVGTNSIQTQTHILVYPNPGSGTVHIDFEEHHSTFNLQVVNMLGKVVFQQACVGDCNVNLSSLRKGIYYLVFRKKDGPKLVKKWVKL